MKTFIVTLIIAILSGMGVGGGGLLVIYLTLFENTEQIIAQGANLAFFIIAATASTIFNAKKKKIQWKTTLIMSTAGIAAAYFGTLLASDIDPSLLQKIFGGMLIAGGGSSLFTSFVKAKSTHSH